MGSRINISVPAQLIERWRRLEGKVSNLSKICQDAIERVVELEELVNMDIPERTKLIMRLRKEMDEYKQRWGEVGLRDGARDAIQLHYEEFLAIEKAWVLSAGITSSDPEASLKQSLGDIPPKDRFLQRLEKLQGEHLFHRENYLRGWIQGVLTVWMEIKDELFKSHDEA